MRRVHMIIPGLWLALGVLSACFSDAHRVSAPDGAAAARWTTDMLDEEWVLETFVSIDGSSTPVLEDTRVTLSFDIDGRVHGNAGCNGYTGAWALDDANVRIGPLLSTRMACASPVGVMQQEQRFLAALEAVHDVLRFGDGLRIDYGSGGDHLLLWQLIREQAPLKPFSGILWELEWFEDTRSDAVTISEILPGSRITAFFDASGTVRGSAGCNDWGASWSISEDGALRLTDIAATEMACLVPAGVMAQEQRFLEALTGMTQVVTDPDHLWLTAADGILVLSFMRRPTGEPDVLSMKSGTSFGKCFGYCWQEVELKVTGATLTQGGWNVEAYPERSAWQPVDTALWGRVSNLPDVQAIQSLDDRIGCPDCADGGAEWIEIETASGSKRVTFEYGSPPVELTELALTLGRLRDKMLEMLDVRTVVR